MARILSNIVWWLIAVWFAGYATLGPHSRKSLNSPITVGELVAFVVIFGLFAGVGKLTARIASRKGFNYVGWSYYGLLVPYIALPHALLKKTTTPTYVPSESTGPRLVHMTQVKLRRPAPALDRTARGDWPSSFRLCASSMELADEFRGSRSAAAARV